MLRGQGGLRPPPCGAEGGATLVCLALICMQDSPPTCPCLAFQGWVPVLRVSFPALCCHRCWTALLYLLLLLLLLGIVLDCGSR